MQVDVSSSLGIPVLALAGRLDGHGAAGLDLAAAALATDAAHWVLDLSRVDYLSSVGVRSLLTIEKRLKALSGGLVLSGAAPAVAQVLRLSGLEGRIRTAAAVPQAVAMARALEGAGPPTEHTHEGRRVRVQRLAQHASVIDWWAPEATAGAAATAGLPLRLGDLDIAFGTAAFGEPPDGAASGAFVATPHFAGVLTGDAPGVSDFFVGDAATSMPVHISQAIGLGGTPAAVAEVASDSAFALPGALDALCGLASDGPRSPAVGVVAVGEDASGRSVLLVGVALAPPDGSPAGEGDRLLACAPDAFALPSGARLAGACVTLDGGAPPTGQDLDGALKALATLDRLDSVVSLGRCPAVMRATAWLFVPGQVHRGIDKLLQVTVEGDVAWRPEWDAIVRQLYADSHSVVVTPLHGGYMSQTFRVVARNRDGLRTLPTVLKIGPTALTDRELQANRDYVSRFILNNGTTLLGDAAHGDWAGLRYNFVGINGPDTQLTWLREHYLERPLPEVLGLFEQLLTRVLKPWYAQPTWEEVFLYRDHTPLRLFPSLLETAEQVLGISADAADFDCPELGCRLPNPFRFLKYEYPRRAAESRLWYRAICHGDLNLQNVLVDERDNLYVIDFSETRPRNALSDFARIEPILKFELLRLESDDDLRRLVAFEDGLTSVTRLDAAPPLRYDGDDPMVGRAHAVIAYLRQCADRVTLFEQDLVPYWLALLEWTYTVVCYVQLPPRHKRYAACSAALICRSIERLERGA